MLVSTESVLGVRRDASTSDIKRAYKSLVLRYHPDKNDIGKREVPNTMFESRAWDKDGVKTVKRNKTVDELVEDLCYTLLACSHPGWEINEGAFGEFTIDSDRNAVSLEFSQRIESVEYSEEEF